MIEYCSGVADKGNDGGVGGLVPGGTLGGDGASCMPCKANATTWFGRAVSGVRMQRPCLVDRIFWTIGVSVRARVRRCELLCLRGVLLKLDSSSCVS